MIWDALQPYVDRLGNTTFALWIGMSTVAHRGSADGTSVRPDAAARDVCLTGLNSARRVSARQGAAQLRREMQPVHAVGLALMLVTGALIFTGGAEAYFAGYWFRLKMDAPRAALDLPCDGLPQSSRAETGRQQSRAARPAR
jgi:hypothetical protein